MNIKKKKLLDEKKIAENLRDIISALGIGQEDFGKLIGKSKTAISSYAQC